ncbi:hypothetical protein [Niallia sp. RD1]|uniref:hypothetical protein n=1 Tax=Niallia sp. RD1 TaxID=2962858 RepID=UPI0020C1AAE6|nr:hypothetical protein [Niallia sp. RD1]UTI42855.1 hypothetical protein NKG37_03685 [Niallia sp. RD1]
MTLILNKYFDGVLIIIYTQKHNRESKTNVPIDKIERGLIRMHFLKLTDNQNKFTENESNATELFLIGLITKMSQEELIVSIAVLSEVLKESEGHIKNVLKKCIDKGFLIKKPDRRFSINYEKIISTVIKNVEVLENGTNIVEETKKLYLSRNVFEPVGSKDFAIIYLTNILDVLCISYEMKNPVIGKIVISMEKYTVVEVIDYD